MRVAFLPCLGVLLSTGTAAAANRFVDTANPAASNDNDGTQSAPWKTLRFAVTAAQDGDLVIVNPGDYTTEGVIDIPQDGLELSAASTREPSRVRGFRLLGRTRVLLQGFTYENAYTFPATWQDMPATVVEHPDTPLDPVHPDAAVQRFKYATWFAIRDALAVDKPVAVDIRGGETITVKKSAFKNYWAAITTAGALTDIHLESNLVEHCIYGILAGGGPTYSSITGNHFRQTLAQAVELTDGADYVMVTNNASEYAGHGHLSVGTGCTAVTVASNVVQWGGYYAETMEHPGASAVAVRSAGAGTTVERNFAGSQVDPSGREGHGFTVQTSGTTSLVNNIAYGNRGGGLVLAETTACSVVNNLLATSTPALLLGEGVTGCKVVNNIFHLGVGAAVQGTPSTQERVDYNLYNQGTEVALLQDGSHAYNTWAELQGAGAEAHGVAADPLFTSEATGDFTLQPGSPAIGVALAALAPPKDFDGTARDAAPDLGPQEFVGSTDPTGPPSNPGDSGSSACRCAAGRAPGTPWLAVLLLLAGWRSHRRGAAPSA